MYSVERNQFLHVSHWFFAWFILQHCRLKLHVPSKRRLTFSGLYVVMSHKLELFCENLEYFILTLFKMETKLQIRFLVIHGFSILMHTQTHQLVDHVLE
jgi:hypothetical protein